MAQFPTLYGEASTGKTKVWSIHVEERNGMGVIESEYGFEDGEKQQQTRYITEGKNIGKKNETTPLQQAINEARAKWIKKKESGYAPREEVAASAAASSDSPVASPMLTDMASRGKASDLSVPFPMLAQSYEDRKHNIKWPCHVQPKLDGVRCVGIPGKGMFSRQRKPFSTLAHIQAEVDQFPSTWVLDGELYSDTLTFQEIVSIVKKESPTKAEAEKQQQIKYHVYDVILSDHNAPFQLRYVNLARRIKALSHLTQIQLVTTSICQNEDAMRQKHAEYIADGYEGIMLRNSAGIYKQATSSSTRSVDLQKYKEFKDGEFEIVGFTQGSGPEEGCVIWVCSTEDGQEFNCRPRGTREERMTLFDDGEEHIGKLLTVRYQELTDDGVPRFPVGIAVRDYE